MKNARTILAETLSERTAVNPHYSLRAFARDLEISPQQLSNVINGRRGISPAASEKIAARLELTPHQKEVFCESLKAEFSVSKSQKIVAQAKLASLAKESTTKTLELDLFKAISNWHHMALIELIKISGKKLSPNQSQRLNWLSQKLGVPENEVKLALRRLERLELVRKTPTGYAVNQDTVISDQGLSPESIRNYHRQILEKSLAALAFQTSDERYGSSSTLPVKVKNLARAKKLIQKFRVEFAKEISDHEDGEEIYALSLQFFRLTQPTTPKTSKEKP